jgi:molybdopterin molybdotransferase
MGTDGGGMLSFDEARARLLTDTRRVSPERAPLGDAVGRVLAADLVALAGPLPPFDNSAMDGYAVATSDLRGAGPWTLDVAGESSAGRAAPP